MLLVAIPSSPVAIISSITISSSVIPVWPVIYAF
jgi:hypothetical protein